MAYKLARRIVSLSLDTYRVPNGRRYVTALRCVTETGRPARILLNPSELCLLQKTVRAHVRALSRRRPLRSVLR